jgi:anti-anti-sigma factor
METCSAMPSSRREIDPTYGPVRTPRASASALDLRVEAAGDTCIVRVKTAKLTYPVLSAFFDQVRAIVDDGTRHLVLDLEAVTYIDSETIGCLVEIHRLVHDGGGAVKLCALQRRVHTMLSMTGVDRFLEVFPDEAEALASPGPAGGRASWA